MDFDCDGCCRDLDTYLDGELSVESRAVFALHLEECEHCLEVQSFEVQMRLVVARCCTESVPEALRVRVLKAIYTARS